VPCVIQEYFAVAQHSLQQVGAIKCDHIAFLLKAHGSEITNRKHAFNTVMLLLVTLQMRAKLKSTGKCRLPM
jgi:hypothetical protein